LPRNEQEVGVGLVDDVLEPGVGGAVQPLEDLVIVAMEVLFRILDVLGVAEGIEEVREIDVDVLVHVLLAARHAGFEARVEQAAHHEEIGRLQPPRLVLEIYEQRT
jgi:hypothetical protein